MALVIKTVKDEKDKIKFVLEGELDLASSQIFKEKVESEYDENPSNLEVDFSSIDFIDSTCLGIMISLSKYIKEEHEIYVVNVKDHIKKVFMLTGLDKLFLYEGDK